MIANAEFQKQPKMFWAYVRTLSQKLGYTTRKTKQIKIPTVPEIVTGLTALGLDPTKLVKKGTVSPTDLGRALLNYFAYRAEVLNDKVQRQLMNAKEARQLYARLLKEVRYPSRAPMNKQTGKKKKPLYFTGIINVLIADGVAGAECDYSPMALTTVTLELRVILGHDRKKLASPHPA